MPLSAEALEILERARIVSDGRRYVFPSPAGDRPMHIEALSKAVQRNLGAFGTDHFVPHDLRRTAASYASGAGVSRIVLGKLLNHVESGVTAVYDRHGYDQEKRQALDRWDRRLREIISGKKSGKVVRLRG